MMNLDEAADQLYGSSLDDFVSERTRLVKELRATGEAEEAATLAKSRKPTVAAWVLNQLARRNRRDIDLLLDAGHRLRDAQATALSGQDRDAFERARKTQSDMLRLLRAAAERLLEEERSGASASVLNQVEEALRAAAISETGREALARGRFVEPPRAEGFEVLSQLADVSSKDAPSRRKDPGRAERREATARLKEARARLREADAAAMTAEREAERANREAENARDKAGRARAQADAAAQAAADAEARVKRAGR